MDRYALIANYAREWQNTSLFWDTVRGLRTLKY
jgi:hypothetical protein